MLLRPGFVCTSSSCSFQADMASCFIPCYWQWELRLGLLGFFEKRQLKKLAWKAMSSLLKPQCDSKRQWQRERERERARERERDRARETPISSSWAVCEGNDFYFSIVARIDLGGLWRLLLTYRKREDWPAGDKQNQLTACHATDWEVGLSNLASFRTNKYP